MSRELVVIVGRTDEQCEPLAQALAVHGWEVHTCGGPARARCPLLSAKECTLRDTATAAIVYLDPTGAQSSAVPLIRCAAASSAPSVVALEGEVGPPRLEGGFAFVGALRRPEVIASTVGDLLGAHNGDLSTGAPDPQSADTK